MGQKNKGLYYWGNYQRDLLDYLSSSDPEKGEDTIESLKEYHQALYDIIQEASDRSLVVAPGLYSEYGYMSYLQGEYDKSIIYYQKEAEQYPEAEYFMARLIEQLKAAKSWR